MIKTSELKYNFSNKIKDQKLRELKQEMKWKISDLEFWKDNSYPSLLYYTQEK